MMTLIRDVQRGSGMRKSKKNDKPFSVWPDDRERPLRYATYAEAEAYAIRSVRRLTHNGITIGVPIEHWDGPVGTARLNPATDKPVVDLTVIGARYA